MLEPDCKFHSQVIDSLEKANISYDLICDSSNCGLLIELARRNHAVSVMSAHAALSDLYANQAVANLPELPSAQIVMCLKGANQRIEGISLNTIANEMTAIHNTRV